MALLDFGTGQQPQQSGGLLGNMDPQSGQLMKLALLTSMMGGGRNRNGGGGSMFSNLLPMMMQMQQAKRQQMSDALRMQEFQMRQNQYNNSMQNFDLQKQKYQRELDDYNRKRQAENDLGKMIAGGEDFPADGQQLPPIDPSQAQQAAPVMPTQPRPAAPMEAASPVPSVSDPANMLTSLQTMLPAALAKGQDSQKLPAQTLLPEQSQAQAQVSLPSQPQDQQQALPQMPKSLAGNSVQDAISANAGIQAPPVPSDAELQNAFSSVKPTDNQGNMHQGAMQKRKIAGYLIQMGQPTAALSLLKSDYGQPIAVATPNGEYRYIQVSNEGDVKELKDYRPIPKKGTVVKDADGNIIFEQGGWSEQGSSVSPTNATETQLQKDVLANQESLTRLKQIGQDVKKSYLTYGGQAAVSGSKFLNKLTGKSFNKEYVQGFTKFTSATDQFFNQYRKEITGAAASVAELDRLKQSMFNRDNAPDEFEAAFDQFVNLTEKTMRLKQQFLRQGIPANSPQMGKMIDEAIFSGQSPVGQQSPAPSQQQTAPQPQQPQGQSGGNVRRYNLQTGRIE